MTAPDDPAGDGRALRAEIGLDAVAPNFAELERMVGAGVTIWACLNGNGYGCGAAAVGRRPAPGPTHSEHLRLDLTGVPGARYGDIATFVGADGDAALGVEEGATMWRTAGLELYGGLRRDPARRHLPESIDA